MGDPKLLDRLSENPWSFTWLRKIAEANFVAVRREVAARLDPQPGQTVLDLGCGTGELAPLFSRPDYLGLDLSHRYIEYARRRFPDYRFGVCDGTRIPVRDRSFDQVLIFGVLHHLEDPIARAMLAEVTRVLRPGGRLLLMEDRQDLPWWNLPGRCVHFLDAGENLRDEEGYRTLFASDLMGEVTRFRFVSGICAYYGFLIQRTDRPLD